MWRYVTCHKCGGSGTDDDGDQCTLCLGSGEITEWEDDVSEDNVPNPDTDT